MTLPLSSLRRKARINTWDAFSLACPYPVLVVDPFEPLADTTAFHTSKFTAGKASDDPQVHWLKKRDDSNAFTGMITIGRTKNNDIIIPAAGVSKFHAFFSEEPDGSFLLADAGSTFGTWHNGDKLNDKSERAKIHPGDEIQLAEDVSMVFYAPRALYEYLKSD